MSILGLQQAWLAEQPEGTHRLVFDPTGDLLAAARECEADVFLARYGNTREQLAQEYGPYEQQSVFLALATPGGDVEAAVRFVVPGPAGLKSLVDVGREPWQADAAASAGVAGLDLTRTWDIATLSARDQRAEGVSHVAALYHGIALATRANGITGTVAILDIRVRRLLGSVGLHYRTLPGTRVRPYLGSSASVPVYAELAELLDNQRRVDPDSYRLFVHGSGLDGVSVPGPEAFVLSQRRVVDLREPAPALALRSPDGS
ncbi:hypothetical protein [Aquipuribacter sp. MA13-6]|uniref:hypothetical protein n=1 Tax=unclassified Aquipuribacter TaxID=2635084 RepID=UPI003EEED8EF